MKKHYLTMCLCELYAMFKTVYPESEISVAMFTTLRSKNVLLLENQPMDQCKSPLHENFLLKLEALRICFDATFLSPALCCSDNYNFECWQEECDKCMNGKNIPFPDILDNEDVTYKEQSQNDHKCLALDTKEFQVDGLKEKLLEGFNIYQSHVRVKTVMHATFEKNKLDPN